MSFFVKHICPSSCKTTLKQNTATPVLCSWDAFINSNANFQASDVPLRTFAYKQQTLAISGGWVSFLGLALDIAF